MSGKSGPDIVENGLVLCLDAANKFSYPRTGTTWTDLSGNSNNGTLTNGPTFSAGNMGSILFDGTNDYTSITTGENFNFGTGNFTIECWVYFNTVSVNSIFMSKYVLWTSNLDFVARLVTSSKKMQFFGGDDAAINITTNDTISASQWYHYTVSRISGVTTIYLNGVSQNSHTGSVSIPNDKTELRIGISHENDEAFNGRISNVKVYKGKGLSASEVLQNYNAVKSRFGL